jgi:hypothetical protein
MSQEIRTNFDDLRPPDPSFSARWAEERRLCAIIESETSSIDAKYNALIELAYLSGVLVNNSFADAA